MSTFMIRGMRIVSVPIPAPTGTRAIFHGDSITAEAGASDHAHSYVGVYETQTGISVRGMSQYSRTVQEGVQSWNATNSLENVVFSPTSNQLLYNPILDYDPDYRYIMFRLGVNDCLQKPNSLTDVTTFKAKYKACLQVFLDKGWPHNKIKIINIGSYRGSDSVVIQAVIDYNICMSEIGSEMNFQVVDLNALDASVDASTLYGDLVHPNDAGHSLHGHYLASVCP